MPSKRWVGKIVDNKVAGKADLVDGKVPTEQLPAGGSGDMLASTYEPIINGKTTLSAVKSDTDIADALTKKHSNSLDPTTAEKEALVGTYGIKGSDNPYVTDFDPRNTNARTPTSHTHAYEPVNSNIQTHVTAAHAPSNAQKNSDITKAEIEAKLTGEIVSHTHAGGSSGGMVTLKKTADQTINGGADIFVDITDLTFPVVNGTDYAFHFYITFQSAATTTGWKAGVDCPTGALDFWAQSDVIANGAAGVATHTERHNTVRNDMTLLTATITAAVDLAVRIEGRYKCTANGTFAARFANELASNTQIVVQKGSWGYYF